VDFESKSRVCQVIIVVNPWLFVGGLILYCNCLISRYLSIHFEIRV
jgi:hypothetical protein